MIKIRKIFIVICLLFFVIGLMPSHVVSQDTMVSKKEQKKQDKIAKKENKKNKKKYKKAKKKPALLVDPEQVKTNSTKKKSATLFGSSTETRDNLSDETLDLYDKYDMLMKQNQFDKALETAQKIPSNLQSPKQQNDIKFLIIFDDIKKEEEKEFEKFGKDESMEPELRKTINRLQREAKKNILIQENDLAKDILIQSIYLDRKNFISKKLLEKCLGLPIGSYKVENIEAKYWKDSLVSLRSGLPDESIKALTVLKSFDQKNPEIFERLGSAYYLAGLVDDAIKAWETALFLNPDNSTLKSFIDNAKVQQKKDQEEIKAFLARKENNSSKVAKRSNVEMQVLRVINSLEKATSYAQSVRESQPGVEVIVEEDDNGKYVVKIPVTKKGDK